MPDSNSKSGSPRQPSSRPQGGIGRGSAFRAGMPDSSLKSGSPGGIGRGSAFRAGMPDSSSKSGSPRQPSSRPPFRRDWPGIRFSSWNAGFQLEKRIPKTTFITAPFQEGLAGDPLFELECRIPARKADPQDNLHHGPLSGGLLFELECRIPARKADPEDNLHHGPLSGGIGRGSAFRAGMPDSSSKSGSPRQPSSRPPFRRDLPGIRFSSWNAGFQREKRIPKTTFITAPFQEGLAGDPLFEPECRIPARKADPQDNLHHGPLSGGTGRGSAFRAGMPDSSSKSGSQRQPSSRPPFRRDWPGIRFSSWNAGFQLEKRIPKTTFITAPFQEGLAGIKPFLCDWQESWVQILPVTSSWNPKWGALFELECRIPARKADPQDNLHHGPGTGQGPLFEPECRIPARKADPQDNLHHGPISGGIGRGSAFRAGMPDSSSKSGSARQPSSRPPFRRDWPGIRFFELECRIPARKADPQDNLHHGPLSGGIGRGSAFRAGMPDSSLKSGSPRQPSSRPPFRRDWPGIRFSSWKLECRIPARKADPQDNLHHGPPFRRDWPGIRFSSWNAGFQLEKRIPKTTFIPLSGGLAGDPLFERVRQPSSRPPVRRDWPGIRFSSWECRIPARKAEVPDSSSKSGSPRQPSSRPPFRRGPLFPQRLCFVFPHIWLFFSALRGSHVFRAQRRASADYLKPRRKAELKQQVRHPSEVCGTLIEHASSHQQKAPVEGYLKSQFLFRGPSVRWQRGTPFRQGLEHSGARSFLLVGHKSCF